MTKLTNEQMAKGRKVFLDGNSEIKARIDGLTKQDADALGITLDHLRESETMRELREYAHANRQDSMEIFWSCVFETAEEVNEMIAARDAAIKQHLGT